MIPGKLDVYDVPGGGERPRRVHRRCACGCKGSLDHLRSDAIWLSGHGKQWRRDHPGEQAPEHAIVVRERKNASGLQLSFWRAVEVLAAELREGWTTDKAARLAAENVLVEALSDRQRERLAKRVTE